MSKNEVKLKDIANYLTAGKRIILLGNYGTGKSRCLRELFFQLQQKEKNQIFYPIAINLKENWGTQRAEEIIRRHMGQLGLTKSADSIVKILGSDHFVFLLDGFDEVGAQVWSDDSSRLKQIRASSLSAVKDLIQNTKSPIIITGREHYFNSNAEMFKSIGLNVSNTILLRCKDEFTEDEMQNYLKSLSLVIDLPIWLPRRPLICQIINSIDKETIENIFIDSNSAVKFWETLIGNICEREARISTILSADNIYKILKYVAYYTRTKQENTGPITIHEINKSFEAIIGIPPVDESAVMLQRLPALGRISSESNDRRFVDLYILDGLRADNLIDIVYESKTEVLNEIWVNPMQKTGIEIIANRIQKDNSANIFIEFLKKATNNCSNKILSGDILASLVYYASKSSLDIEGVRVDETKISALNFSHSLIENFSIKNSEIDQLDISNCSFSRISFQDCAINKLYGISSQSDIPQFLESAIIETFESQPMEANNRLHNLKPSHMIFISIIKKIFFLDGKGKPEKEILNGFGSHEDKQIASAIIKILVRDKIIAIQKNGQNYLGKSFHRTKMAEMLKDLSKTKENIWKEVANLR